MTPKDRIRQLERDLWNERDRRYSEVQAEKDKALQIKQTADSEALGLARQNIAAEFEKANRLREQISSERGDYATKKDLSAAVDKIGETIRPLTDYVSAQQGKTSGATATQVVFFSIGGLLLAALSVAVALYLKH